jgi:hypothetical protein
MTRPFQPIAECLWSVPAFRPSLMSNDDYEFDSYWLCERTTAAVRVTQATAMDAVIGHRRKSS